MGNQITSFLKTRNSLKTFSDSKYKVLSAGKMRNTHVLRARVFYLRIVQVTTEGLARAKNGMRYEARMPRRRT